MLLTASKTSCLTALYFRRYSQMQTSCPLMVADRTDYAVGVGKNQFIVSSVNGTLVKKIFFFFFFVEGASEDRGNRS